MQEMELELEIDAALVQDKHLSKGSLEIKGLFIEANLLIKNQEYTRSVKYLKMILERKPDFQLAIKSLADCYQALGLVSDAVACFRELTQLNENSHTLTLLGNALYEIGNDSEALLTYQKALAINVVPTDPEIHFCIHKNMGNIYTRQGDYVSAQGSFDRAYGLNPESDILMVNLGVLELQKANLVQAGEMFRRALRINSKNAQGWVGLALVHREFADPELARANIEIALDLAPGNETAWGLAISWGMEDNNAHPIVNRLRIYLKKYPEDTKKRLMLAKLLSYMNYKSQSVSELKYIMDKNYELKEASDLYHRLCGDIEC